MKKYFVKYLLLIVCVCCSTASLRAQLGTRTTLAHCGTSGFSGDGGPATSTGVNMNPAALAVDSSRDVFVSDNFNHRIRRVDGSTGIITTIAGSGTAGYSGDGGAATAAKFGDMLQIAASRSGDCYLVDYQNHRIRKIDHNTGIITTVAGSGAAGYTGNGGPATAAALSNPGSIFIDTGNNIYFTDETTIRKVDASTGIIHLFAGDSSASPTVYDAAGDGGPATAALLLTPNGLTGDLFGNIFVSGFGYDSIGYYSGKVRKINAAGNISTVVGNGIGGYSTVDAGPGTATGLVPNVVGTDAAGNLFFLNGTLMRLNASSGIINNLYFGASYAGLQVVTVNDGKIYLKDSFEIRKFTGVFPGIDRATIIDSIVSSPCSIPSVRGFGIYGTLASGVPSATDSVTVLVKYSSTNYGFFDAVRTFKIPYWFSAGVYGFGVSSAVLDSYTYTFPGIYERSVTLTTLGGYVDQFNFTDTIRANCSTTITGAPLLNIASDSLETFGCVMPQVYSLKFYGELPHGSGYASSTDSVYALVDFGDSTGLQPFVFPFIGLDSCTVAVHHTYTTYGVHFAKVAFITSNGQSNGFLELGFAVNNRPCSGYTFAPHISLNHASSTCSYPDTVTYNYYGYADDSAAMSPAVRLHVYFGDGTDSMLTVPILPDFFGSLGINGQFKHVFTMPGAFSSYHSDTASGITTGGIVDYHTTPSVLVVGSSCTPVSGYFYIDSNSSCSRGSTEVLLPYWPYALINNTVGDTTYGWCDNTGHYGLSVVTGDSYTIIVDPSGAFHTGGYAGATLTPSCPSTGIYTFTATSTTVNHDFALSCASPGAIDMAVSAWGNRFTPGDTGSIAVWASNGWGYTCDTLSSSATLILDTAITYIGMWSGPTPTSISGDTLRWNFVTTSSALDFYASVKVVTHTTATVFDTIHNIAIVAPTRISDTVMGNNTYSWHSPVIASWDPNEKQVSPQGFGTQGFIPNGTPLSYEVHFQNTGSAPARNITVVDTINSNLDLSTLQVVSSSSPVLVFHEAGNVIKFRFNDIYLPDSVSNPSGSIGTIAYNIVPKDDLPAGTVITNTANIFFDYNPGVATNATTNTIEDTIGVIYGADSVCQGGSITLSNHISGGVWSASNSHATVVSGVVTGVTPGIDTITYTVYGDVKATKAIRVTGLVAATITGSSAVCTGATTTLSASISGGSWSTTGSGIISVSSSGAVTGVAVGTDTVLYTSTATCGTGIARMPVSVTTTPSVGTITSGSSVCVGSSISLAASGSTGGTWTSSNTSGTISSTSLSGVSAGIDTVTYSLSNSCGTSSVSAAVTINPRPAAGTLSGSSSVCVGATTTITSSASGGSWSASNASASVSGGVVTGSIAGTDTISYTVTNGCGSSVVNTVVTINPLPVAGSLSGASAVCVGAIITLTPSVSGGSWSVSGSAASVSGGVVSGIGAGTDTIFYTVFNGCGSAVVHAVVTVNPLPSAGTISGGSTVCAGASFTLTTSISGGSWSASGSAATVSGGVVSGVSAGTDTIFYSISNICGTDVAQIVINVNPLPVAGTLSGGSSVCAGSTTTVTASVSGGTWTSSSAAFATVSGGVVTGVGAGVDSVFYTVSNSCGSDIIFRLVTVNPLPVAGTLSAGSSVCVGATLTLTPSISGGSWRSGSAGFATVSGGVVTGVTAGVDSIFYSVTNSCGTDIIYRLLTVNPLPSAGVLSGVDSVCIGATSTLSSSSAGGAWSSTNVAIAMVSSAGVVTGISTGMARIYYIQTNSCGADTAWTNFIVKSLPVAGTISGTDSICSGSSVTLTTTGTGGTWVSSNTAVTTVLAGSVTGVSAGVDTILYIVANSCGIDSDRFTFTVLTAPATTTVSGLSNVCVGDTILLSAAMAGGLWSSSSSSATISGSGVVTGVTAGSTTISYAVTNLCGTTYSTFAVTVNPIPSAGTIVGVDTICLGMAFHFTDAAGSGTWSSSNSAIATVSGSGIVRGLSTGTVVISYTVTSICGTISATRTMFVRAASDCPEEVKSIGNQSGNDIAIFPNPSSGTFNIELPTHEGDVSISVTDVHGKVVKTLLVSDNKQLQIPIDMTNYAAGVYLIKAEVDGRVWRKKVIVM